MVEAAYNSVTATSAFRQFFVVYLCLFPVVAEQPGYYDVWNGDYVYQRYRHRKSLPVGGAGKPPRRQLGGNQVVSPPDQTTPSFITPMSDDCPTRNSCFSLSTAEERPERQAILKMPGDQFAKRNCFCDKLCYVYNDCCHDIEQSVNTRIDGVGLKIACEQFREIDQNYVFMYYVNSCPNSSETFHKANCLKFFTHRGIYRMPVSRQSDGLLFANIYCAMCNGETNVSYWSNVTVSCPKRILADMSTVNERNASDLYNEAVTSGTLLTNCTVSYRHNVFLPRYCKRRLASCKEASDFSGVLDDLRDKCHSQPAAFVYTSNSTIYRNKYCALCNGVSDSELLCKDPLNYPTFTNWLESGPSKALNNPTSFAILIDLNSGIGNKRTGTVGTIAKETVEQIVVHKKCEENEVFDPFARICRPLRCRAGYIYTEELQSCTQLINQVDKTLIQKSVDQLQCPYFTLRISDIEVLLNKSLYYRVGQKIFPPHQYRINGEKAFVCNTHLFTKNFTDVRNDTKYILMHKFDYESGIITYVCVIISLIAMAILIFIYSCKAALRNLPGKIMLSLISSLFTAQLLFIIGIRRVEIHFICVGFAASMHFFLLAAFLWMNVMAVDLFITFSSDSYQPSDNNKRFIKYCIYAWLMPFLIVTPAVLMDVYEIGGDFRPHYAHEHLVGGEPFKICWLTSSNALLVWFAVPLAFVMASNFTLFVITIRNIYVISQMTRQVVADKPSKGHFFLCIKLSIIVGLTWLFGFLAAIFDNAVFYYIFVILNTLQGLIIAAMFLCTRRVYRILKASVHRKPVNNNLIQTSEAVTRRTYVPINTRT